MFMDSNKRNTLIALGGLGVVFVGFQVAPSLLPARISFVDLDRPAGFRKYTAGDASSGSFDPFAGLGDGVEDTAMRERRLADDRVQTNVCAALYGGLDLQTGQVPMASFSDYYCPFCRVQTRKLAELTKARQDVAVAWHELPLLGENSTLAAKAALAANRQGAYVEFHDHLMKAPFIADLPYLRRLSEDIGVDFDTLIADMNSEDINNQLQDSAALSRVFAFVGTPALVIGRSVVQGQINDRGIEAIIEMESDGAWSNLCNP